MRLPTLADRAWYAYHCLPRSGAGKLPTFKELEVSVGIAYGTLSHVMKGRRSQHQHETFREMARALRVSEAWLHGDDGARGPTLTGMLPPRPGTKWVRHGDVPGWRESVALAQLEPKQVVQGPAFLAGADLPVFRPLDRITPDIALAASMYAFETATPEEQTRYSTQYARQRDTGHAPALRRVRKA